MDLAGLIWGVCACLFFVPKRSALLQGIWGLGSTSEVHLFFGGRFGRCKWMWSLHRISIGCSRELSNLRVRVGENGQQRDAGATKPTLASDARGASGSHSFIQRKAEKAMTSIPTDIQVLHVNDDEQTGLQQKERHHLRI